MRPLLIALLAITLGCNRKSDPTPTDAGPGNYARIGPIGLSVEEVRHGKVKMRGMLGATGESKDAVLTVRTRFKLFDTAVPVKQSELQRDGSLMSGGLLKLKDSAGKEFKSVGGFGFDAVQGRRADTAILTADKPEASDVLTFESVEGAKGALILDVSANYQIRQPEGTFRQPVDPGVFRFRLPRATWVELTPPPE